MNYFEVLLEKKEYKEETLNNINKYLTLIKNFLNEKYKTFKLLIFGSYVKKQIGPNSDIDVLIIIPVLTTEQRHHLNYEIRKQIDFNPFIEIHITTEEEFNNWWKNFIKNDYIEF
jgi:predicted nucleotidyltransferase